MNIIYLTTSMRPQDFYALMDKCSIKPNPSNQNFHHKLISLLGKDHRLEVISIRPVSHITSTERFFPALEADNYHYVGFHNTPLRRRFDLFNNSIKIIKKIIETSGSDTLIIVDGLSFLLAKIALKIKNLFHVPVLAIYTDNPCNITGVTEKYITNIERLYGKFDLFFTITPGLNLRVNKMGRPSMTYEGMVDPPQPFNPEITKKYGRYFFFAGALYERYGLKNLIDGFLSSNVQDKLLIAGHGPGQKDIIAAQEKCDRIIYLGLLSEKEVAEFASAALACINPRPLNEQFDQQSLPSKVLQYLNSGVPVISSKHPRLYQVFKEDVIWLKDTSSNTIKETIEQIASDPYQFQVMAKKGRIDVQMHYGQENMRKRINDFLAKNVRF